MALQAKHVAALKTLLLISFGTAINMWVIWLLPLDKLPFHGIWPVIAFRLVATISSLALMRVFCPTALTRVSFRMNRPRALGSLAILAFILFPSLLHVPLRAAGISIVAQGLFFALWIGIDEEIFSRGFVFGVLEKYGIGVAAVLSSVHFGLLHAGNYLWGGQSFSYTLAQVLNAAAFGYLCAGLMIFTGSIWIPIVLHGLSDFPMQLQTAAQFTQQVTGNPSWIPTIMESLFMVMVGWALLRVKSGRLERFLLPRLKQFGLVE